MQRFFLALHATLPAALIVAVFVHLWGPPALPSLAQRPVWATWVFIATWLLLSALAAWALPRRLALWRVALGGAGALLALAGGVGLALGSALAPGMLASLALVGAACAGIAAFIGPQRVQAPRRKAARPAAAAAPGRGARPGASTFAARRRWWHWGTLGRLGVSAHLPFWLAGALAVESFRLAHIVATEPARPSGMVGLLLAFFIALPAATLRYWSPRASLLLWAMAALAYGGLSAKAGLAQWAAASALCAMAGGAAPRVHVGRALRSRQAGRATPAAQGPASDRHPPKTA